MLIVKFAFVVAFCTISGCVPCCFIVIACVAYFFCVFYMSLFACFVVFVIY